MGITSFSFLCFFAVALTLYYILPGNWQWRFLLLLGVVWFAGSAEVAREGAWYVGCYDDPKALERCLLLQRAGAKEVMEEAERRLRLLDTALERLRKDETMMQYDVTIKTIPERQVASVRQIISSYDREGDLWSVYCQETARMNIQDGDPVLCVAVYHDG